MIHVVATIANPVRDRRWKTATATTASIEVFRWLTPIVRAEVGCIEYQATIDVPTTIAVQEGPRADVVTVIEKWDSVEALYAHGTAPHMTEYRTKVKDFVVSVKLQVTEPAY